MVRKRSSEKTADDFIEAAEEDASWKQEETVSSKETVDSWQLGMPTDTPGRVKARAKASLKRGIYTMQATTSQKALMDYAAEKLDISKAKLIERYFFASLEEEFGADVPIIKE